MKKIKILLLNVVLVIVSIGAALTVMELIMPRLNNFSLEEAVYQVRRPVVQYLYGEFNPDLRYTLQKGLKDIRLNYPGKLDYTFSTNSEGFRGPEWDMSPERRNVLLLGDSFGFGWGVAWEETVGKLLEKRLQGVDPRYQVVNLAISGYSVNSVVRSFELYKDRFKPEMVVYVFCPNDLESISPPLASGGYQIAYKPHPGDKDAWVALRERNQPGYWSWDKFRRGSYLHAFYARYVRPIISKRIRASLHNDVPPAGFDFPPPMPEVVEPPDTAQSRFLIYCLDRLGQQVDGQLYIIPTSDKTILVQKDNAQNLRWVLAKYCRDNKRAHFVDFENVVRRTADGRKFYFKYDDHWTVAGHQLAADMLFDSIFSAGNVD
ncbi:MAG: GDSL-type esterase/lipase family protein [Desulfobulbaceae bacterium]|nr:GDSL-type esterase/lipase family protein [Desulfobulbaceae bacterium]